MADLKMPDNDQPLLVADRLSKSYGKIAACRDVSFVLYPGEVLAIVGESGSGKSTLLQLLSGQLAASSGHVSYRMRDGVTRDLATLGEAERRFLFRTDWGYVHQDPAQGRLLDLLRNLVAELHLAVVIVTHDLAVARLLSHRVMVMKGGRVIETGLTDQVLDDPHEPYTQLLVSSILPP